MKKSNLFGLSVLRVNGYLSWYFDGKVDDARKAYPSLKDARLLPLLLPVSLIFLGKTGQAAGSQLKLSTTLLDNANIYTVLELWEQKESLHNYRGFHQGRSRYEFVQVCLIEFLVDVGIDPRSLEAKLKEAKNNPTPPVKVCGTAGTFH